MNTLPFPRCFLSDGILPDGTPLVGHLAAKFGAGFMIPYTICEIFIVSPGALVVQCKQSTDAQRSPVQSHFQAALELAQAYKVLVTTSNHSHIV